jgi:phosphoserine phosphatase
VPLLERVTNPVATNPDARLRAIATERGWPVIELFGRA